MHCAKIQSDIGKVEVGGSVLSGEKRAVFSPCCPSFLVVVTIFIFTSLVSYTVSPSMISGNAIKLTCAGSLVSVLIASRVKQISTLL